MATTPPHSGPLTQLDASGCPRSRLGSPAAFLLLVFSLSPFSSNILLHLFILTLSCCDLTHSFTGKTESTQREVPQACPIHLHLHPYSLLLSGKRRTLPPGPTSQTFLPLLEHFFRNSLLSAASDFHCYTRYYHRNHYVLCLPS